MADPKPRPEGSASPLPGRWDGLFYGGLGLPLAFVALPLYVVLPDHYATEFGVPLASLGLLLLLARAADAVLDPWIGRAVDRLLRRPPRDWAWVAAAAGGLMWVSFQGLFFPPVRGEAALLGWCALTLAGCYLAYSTLSVLHAAWGAGLGGDAPGRARVVAWREGLALPGVILASVLPGWLGLQVSSGALALCLAVGLVCLSLAPRPRPSRASAPAGATSATSGSAASGPSPAGAPTSPLRHPRFRRLLIIYLLNGVASALPATLVLFFVRDRLQAPDWAPAFLGAYFAAAALSLPLWVRGVARWGLARSWALGMALSVISFAGACTLGSGDVLLFGLICLASGAALGADLSVPPALLAGLLQETGEAGRSEGAWFGWWQFTTKFNLALAAGVALPLLQSLGYEPGHPDARGGLALALMYGALPCALKSAAGLALWRLWIRNESKP